MVFEGLHPIYDEKALMSRPRCEPFTDREAFFLRPHHHGQMTLQVVELGSTRPLKGFGNSGKSL